MTFVLNALVNALTHTFSHGVLLVVQSESSPREELQKLQELQKPMAAVARVWFFSRVSLAIAFSTSDASLMRSETTSKASFESGCKTVIRKNAPL